MKQHEGSAGQLRLIRTGQSVYTLAVLYILVREESMELFLGELKVHMVASGFCLFGL